MGGGEGGGGWIDSIRRAQVTRRAEVSDARSSPPGGIRRAEVSDRVQGPTWEEGRGEEDR